MINEPSTPQRPRVAIVGGGYAGTRLARSMDSVADVTVIEQHDRFIHNIAAIRAVTDPSWLDRILLPYDALLLKGEVLRGEVTAVQPGSVTLADGQKLEADYVVLAPGSSYALPFKPAKGEGHMAYRRRVHAAHDRLRAARAVTIIGAGPVGIELAGEIKHAFPHTEVTLLSAHDRLLPGYSPRLDRRLRKALAGKGVHLKLGQRALDGVDATEPFGPAIVRLEGGGTVAADLVFAVGGATPNTGFLAGTPGVELGKGRIRVDDHLQLPGMPHVYAIGDAALTADTMTIGGIERQVPYLEQHLKGLIAGTGGQTQPYQAWKSPVIVVPVGPDGGASQLPASLVMGRWVTRLLKGRTLMVGKARRNLGLGGEV